ncbi:MAG: site-specific integrase, partial [Candidatus Omnitrophica bacterium]|nr:site-specific integrase [Candidatus Omnitrophota bacterium]
MAVRQLPSGRWQIYYRANGVRKKESFRTKKEAEKIFALRKTEIFQDRFQIRSKQSDIIRFEVLGKEYLELHSKARNKSWKKDEQRFKRLDKFFGKRRVTEISPLDVERFKVALKKEVSGATVNRHLALMGAIYNWAIRMGQIGDARMRSRWSFITSNPVKWVRREREKARDRILWPEEEKRLEQVCFSSPDYRMKDLWDLIQFSLNTGMRKSEQLLLMWSQVDLNRSIITLHETKNGDGRIVPINDTVKDVLLRWKCRSKGNYVFVSHRGEHYISIHKGFYSALKKADIEGLRWHDLRGTFCTRLDML